MTDAARCPTCEGKQPASLCKTPWLHVPAAAMTGDGGGVERAGDSRAAPGTVPAAVQTTVSDGPPPSEPRDALRERIVAWSYGGGVQSTAIACLVASGRLPKPDLIVMADTGREASVVWRYLHEAVRPLLRRVDLDVEIAPHSLSTVDLYSGSGKLLIPAYTKRDGKIGQLPTYCSVEWKRRVVRRWLRSKGVRRCDLWIGITTDEASRAKDADVQWITHRWPLLDLNLSRADCVKIIEDAGLPPAPRSSCWMCPFRGAEEWATLEQMDFRAARNLDEDIRQHDPDVYLLRSAVPLTREAATGKGQTDGCEGGYCWT